ncbi:MAG: histidine triad nucleotide-binding protein [Candidatus Accumulibacter sp.]|uniref:histidine triad nucleotide-binding protein n=1 Tax=Accumulibacter sp. TaxID=2053492 RepID=UPI0025E36063|nr:histidine triad nucleotide-binding protein [Accumulibacter sp.]MCP5248913.1 histidine triad nucleotide-binding protein [Accumulibacter sp.]
MENCLFCKIAAGDIPSRKVYEDDELFAFHDINPARPVHILVIPKRHITSLASSTEADLPVLGRMLAVANRLATEQGSPDGFRLIINTGAIGHQEVQHLHAHIVGGPEPVGPMLKRV